MSVVNENMTLEESRVAIEQMGNTIEAQRVEIARLRDNLNDWQDRYHAVRQEFEEFKQRVRSRMIEEAERRDWCRDFDMILIEFGLEPRTQNWDVVFTVEGTVTRTVLARDEDHAAELVRQAMRIEEQSEYSLGRSETLYIRDISCESVEPSEG